MWLFKNEKTPNYSKTSTGIDLQTLCKGCNQIEILIDLHQSPSRQSKPLPGRLPFHADFAELDACAQRCHTCRIFRQALLVRCGTSEEAETLAERTRECPVFVRIRLASAGAASEQSIAFRIEIKDHPERSAIVHGASKSVQPLNLPENPQSRLIPQQVEAWLRDCRQNHTQSCAALRWSSKNPTRLIRIVSGTELQLCSDIDKQVQYAALTYSWGSNSLTESDMALVQQGMTTFANIKSRATSFLLADLPATLRDAIILLRRVGMSHVWIDSVCIVQDPEDTSDFIREAPNMHSYYGNALFTLAVCSNSKATSPMLVQRSAYSHITRPCHLRGHWLTSPTIPMAEVLNSSPLTKRAWTLQEEHLSPRVLYWSANKMYWSCAGSRHEETSDALPSAAESNDADATVASGFLTACRKGDATSLHREWLALVTSYALRDMTNELDRFPALSGLASRYQSSCQVSNSYLTGLWESTLAQDLSWRVLRAADSPTVQRLPSWTWASLPLCTGIEYDMDNKGTARLEFLSSRAGDDAGVDENEDDVSRGPRVTQLRVRARLRPFWHDEAALCDWSSILAPDTPAETQRSKATQKRPLFSFEAAPEWPLFSVDRSSGMIVSYEARRQETLGQLDHVLTMKRVMAGSLRVVALQLTDTALLLVEEVDDGSLRRVGVASGYRSGFFDGVDVSEVELV